MIWRDPSREKSITQSRVTFFTSKRLPVGRCSKISPIFGLVISLSFLPRLPDFQLKRFWSSSSGFSKWRGQESSRVNTKPSKEGASGSVIFLFDHPSLAPIAFHISLLPGMLKGGLESWRMPSLSHPDEDPFPTENAENFHPLIQKLSRNMPTSG